LVSLFWEPRDIEIISKNILKKAYPNDECWFVHMLGSPDKQQNADEDSSDPDEEIEFTSCTSDFKYFK